MESAGVFRLRYCTTVSDANAKRGSVGMPSAKLHGVSQTSFQVGRAESRRRLGLVEERTFRTLVSPKSRRVTEAERSEFEMRDVEKVKAGKLEPAPSWSRELDLS